MKLCTVEDLPAYFKSSAKDLALGKVDFDRFNAW